MYAVGTSLAIVGLGIVGAFMPTFRASLETVVGGLCGTLAIYCGGNVVGKLAIGKASSYGFGESSGYNQPYGAGVAVMPMVPNPVPPVEPIPEER